MSDFPFTLTRYGFQWGEMRLERIASEPKFGVVIFIGTAREQWEVRVSPMGRKMTITKRETAYWSTD